MNFRLTAATAGLLILIGTSFAGEYPMGFFITSVGIGDGENLGGLAGADAHCISWPRRLDPADAPGVPI